ncbi:MAG: tRNA (adenosine(37)-N6)-dimethylallyltransferase MiaA [Candidatus Aminicenantes bacterium]|nr:MAG: tRNA (adenosine(37)-N6)-dimethylallyltransferase MiaA [Candidatus Aminicenantes bacterium]
MEPEAKNLVIVLGATAVGKSATAILLAEEFNGEIINCDSMQVYKGFDIGTDKISSEQSKNIPHHLLDIADASTQFTAADFVKHALEAIRLVRENQKLPIIAGGTGLYLKALCEGLFPEGEKDQAIRAKLEQQVNDKGLEFLRESLLKIDPVYAKKIGARDKIRIIRALEVFYSTQKPISAHFANTRSQIKDFFILKIGLKLERSVLYRKIEDRVDRMFEKGIVEEVQHLLAAGVNLTSPPFRALGYRQVLKHLRGDISLEEAIDLTKKETRQYAKRQMTWFRKMEGIRWFETDDFPAISAYMRTQLKGKWKKRS